MDNFRFDITSRGDLRAAMGIAFSETSKAVGYCVRPAGDRRQARLIFFWSDFESPAVTGMQRLPFTLDASGAADFATRWLSEVEYGPQDDHDGHDTKGWRIYNESWGHIEELRSAFVAITPEWAMHGK